MPNRAAAIRALLEAAGGQVIERTRHGVGVRLPDGSRRFRVSVTPIHLADGTEIDTDLEDRPGGGWRSKPGVMPFGLEVGDDGSRRWTPRPGFPDEWIEFGPLEYLGAGNRWRALPRGLATKLAAVVEWESADYRLTVAQTSTRAKELLVVKHDGAALPAIRWPVTVNGLTRDGLSFRGQDGEVAGWLREPRWWDSGTAGGLIPWEWSGGYVTFTAPDLSAVYPDGSPAVWPVTFDPTVSVSASGDDGHVYNNATFQSGQNDCHAGNSWIGSPVFRNDDYDAWFRFQSITADQGDTCSAAHITWVAAVNGDSDPQVKIYGVDEDDHAAPTDTASWSTDHGIHTTAAVDYDPGSTTAGNSYDTGSLTSILDELFARGSWVSGNDIGIHFDNDQAPNQSQLLYVAAQDHSTYAAAELDYTLTAAAQNLQHTAVDLFTAGSHTVELEHDLQHTAVDLFTAGAHTVTKSFDLSHTAADLFTAGSHTVELEHDLQHVAADLFTAGAHTVELEQDITDTGNDHFTAGAHTVGLVTLDLDVQLAFGYTWLDSSPAWTSVKADVRDITVSRGRQRQLDKMQAGGCTLTLANSSRQYEPGFTLGDNYPNVKIGTPLRVRATIGGITYPVFYGYVTAWHQTYREAGMLTQARVRAVDVFGMLARHQLVRYTDVVAGLETPFSYWRLQETGGGTATDEGSDGNDGTYVGSPVLAQTGPLTGVHYAVEFDDAADYVNVGAPSGAFDCLGSWTWSAWLYRTGTSELLFEFDNTPDLAIETDASGKVQVTASAAITDSGLEESVTAATALTASTWTHVTVRKSGNTYSIFLDGALDASGSIVMDGAANPTESFAIGASSGGWTGLVSEVALWSSALSNGQILAASEGKLNTLAADTADGRIGTLLDTVGWPTGASWRDLDAGDFTLSAIAEPSGSALELIQAAAQADGGSFWQDASGVLHYSERHATSGVASAGTLTDDGTDYAEAVVSMDEEGFANRAIVTVTSGAEYISAVTGTDYAGTKTISRSVDLGDSDGQAYADWLVGRASVLENRVRSVVIQPERDPSVLWPLVMARDLFDVFTFTRFSSSAEPLSTDLSIQGVTMRGAAGRLFEVTWQTGSGASGVWVLGTSTLGTDTYLASG